MRIHDLWYSGPLIYDWSEYGINITKQFSSIEERTEKVVPETHLCRVYRLANKTSGYSFYSGKSIITGTYDECKKVFDELSEDSYVELQVYNKNKIYGTSCLIDNKDEEYTKGYKKYIKSCEEKDTWRPGNAPWDAPGMSIRDFI